MSLGGFAMTNANLYNSDEGLYLKDPILSEKNIESVLTGVLRSFLALITPTVEAISFCIFREVKNSDDVFIVGANILALDDNNEDEVDATKIVEMMLKYRACIYSRLLNTTGRDMFPVSVRVDISDYIENSTLLITTDCIIEGFGHNHVFSAKLIYAILAVLSAGNLYNYEMVDKTFMDMDQLLELNPTIDMSSLMNGGPLQPEPIIPLFNEISSLEIREVIYKVIYNDLKSQGG